MIARTKKYGPWIAVVIATGALLLSGLFLHLAQSSRLEDLEQENEDATYVINEQLIPAVLDMAARLQVAGLQPPCVRATPESPPYAVQQKQIPPCSG